MSSISIPSTDAEGAQGGSSAPDWDHVPFDVGCARCGHDLRGRSDPICPACGLAFDWAEAVPIERLTCVHCDYHLYGLQEKRCPECGNGFTWEEALAEYHRRRIPLFEYRWRERPVRSFVGTCFRSLRPATFWITTDIHAPVRVGPLIAFAATALLAYFSTFMLLLAAVQWLDAWHDARMWKWFPSPRPADFVLYVFKNVGTRELWAFLISVPIWVAAVLASLLVFRQSMHRCKLRNAHVVRVWAYATPVFPVVLAIGCFSAMAAGILRGGGTFRGGPLVIIVLVVTAFTLWATHIAYRRYLLMPHSFGVAVASQMMAFLLASICDFVVWAAWSRGGLFVQMYVQLFSSGNF